MKIKTNKRKYEFGFGIGCLIFYSQDKNIQPKFFIKELEGFLNKQTNISNIKVNLPSDPFMHGGLSSIERFPAPQYWHPAYCKGQIEFELFLPKKNQKAYLFPPSWDACESEKFKIIIMYNDSGLPVSIVKPLGLSESPSDGVVLLWHYLDTIVKNGKLSFRIQGPSPAHFDVYVYSDTTINKKFDYKYIESIKGYDSIEIIYNPNRINRDIVERFIYKSIAGIFGEYYVSIAKDEYVMLLECDFTNTYENFIKRIKKSFFPSFALYCSQRNIQKSFIQLTDFDLANAVQRKLLSDAISELKKREKLEQLLIGKEYIIKEYMDMENKDIPQTSSYYRALEYFEKRCLSVNSVLATIIAAIVGGLLVYLIK